jgi:malto-oligosyltrehalose trehalohydrolase
MKRIHNMPFGTELLPSGETLFRLWAPSAKAVSLLIAEEQATAMEKEADGWFLISTTKAGQGAKYSYLIDNHLTVPDPASRFQPFDVHGPSEVIDPRVFDWQDASWRGRPWHETVIYELNVGTFTPQGTYQGIKEKLDYLVDLGVTAIELMPLSDFPGRWNWGYDGVLPFAPDSNYGTTNDLKDLIQSAHEKNLMVFLDVVYNHLGPEGNYLHAYCQPFFTERHHTPWGAAINFDGPDAQLVRQFFIHNALFWLEEYNVDGLRLDAVHAIEDESPKHILKELAEAVQDGPGKERLIHLVLENDRNQARFLERGKEKKPLWYVAQWNDDFHHATHVLCTEEAGGYYSDYSAISSPRSAVEHLGRALAEGFSYHGERSTYRGGEVRGEPSQHLPPTAFVNFIQNHDQIGNRAFGERLSTLSEPTAVKAIAAILLLSPTIPLLYMGEEWGADTPFCFFSDLGPELAPLVSAGRRNEFAHFPDFADSRKRALIPDPCAEPTFNRSKLKWQQLAEKNHHEWWGYYRELLRIRRQNIMPLLPHIFGASARHDCIAQQILKVTWSPAGHPDLVLLANPTRYEAGASRAQEIKTSSAGFTNAQILFQTQTRLLEAFQNGIVPAWSVIWMLSHETAGD